MSDRSWAYRVMRINKAKLKSQADSDWSKEVRLLAGNRCEKCGSVDRVQAHHVFTRANKSTRWYIPNGVALCSGHHKFFAHMKPHEFRDWIIERRGQAWWDELTIRKNIRHIR